MRPVVAAAMAAVAAVLVLWLLPRDGGSPTLGSGSGGGAWQTQIAALKAELAEERLERQLLASEVELMREVLLEFGDEYGDGDVYGELSPHALEEFSESHTDLAADEDPDGSDSGSGDESEDQSLDDAAEQARKQNEPVFQFDKLVEAGVAEFEAERVRDIWYQIELDKLELRDRATREGWNSKRLKRQLEDVKRDAIDELGECGYDSLLYGTGKNNRVIVRDVLAGSVAARAGLLAGDVVVRYGDTRVWAARDLVTATSGGERGEPVTVDVERNGEKLYLRVERGPFGMFMRQDSVVPGGC